MSFTPIETQEQFDEAIKERLAREKKTLAEKYKDYDELREKVASYEKQTGELASQIESLTQDKAGHDQVVADLEKKIAGYETASLKAKVAHEVGIPYELASRLSGEDEESIKKDAEMMKGLLGSTYKAPPLGATEPPQEDETTKGLRTIVNGLKGD